MLALLTSRLAGPIASGVAVILLLFGVSQCAGRAAAEKRADGLQAEISRPVTGWAARLTTCQGNEARLEEAVKDQNGKVEKARREGAAMVATADAAAARALKGQAAAEAKVRTLLSVKPTGAGKCADYEAVDAALLETLR